MFGKVFVASMISCEGALESFHFNSIGGNWTIFIDDMDEPAASGSIGTVAGQLSLAFLDKISFDYDGFLFIQNTDNVPHRIKMIPISATSFDAESAEDPTFTVNIDGSITFCLAPSTP